MKWRDAPNIAACFPEVLSGSGASASLNHWK